MRKPFYLVLFLLVFLLGIAVFKFIKSAVLVFGLLGFVLIILNLIFPRIKIIVLLSFFALAAAWLRWEVFTQVQGVGMMDYNGREIVFLAQVVQEVERKIDKQKVVLRGQNVFLKGGWRRVQGKILLTTSLYPEYFYGDVLKIKGKLKTPEAFSYKNEYGQEIEFHYDDYLRRYKIFSLLYYPKEVEVVVRDQGNTLMAKLLAFKRLLVRRLNSLLPEPQASFLAGLLWGARSGMDPQLLRYFNQTGTTHIVALSGFNITIIGVLLFLLAPWLFIKRQTAYWLVLIVITLFVFFSGGQASVVRAAIMGGLALTAYYLGRSKSVFVLLILAAAIMVAANPLVMFYDVGFQLSFLATVGLVYLAPKLERYFPWLPQRFSLRESAVATLSAVIFTLPLIAYEFKRVALFSLVTNILILPAIPLVMLLGFSSIALSFISFFVGKILSAAVWLVLSYIIAVVRVMSGISGGQLLVDFSLPVVFILYFILWSLMIYLYRFELKSLKRRLKIF